MLKKETTKERNKDNITEIPKQHRNKNQWKYEK